MQSAFLRPPAGGMARKLVHVSTDFVFDGTASSPIYHVGDSVAQGQFTAATKLAGELACKEELGCSPVADNVRTAWVYAAGHPNFVDDDAGL